MNNVIIFKKINRLKFHEILKKMVHSSKVKLNYVNNKSYTFFVHWKSNKTILKAAIYWLFKWWVSNINVLCKKVQNLNKNYSVIKKYAIIRFWKDTNLIFNINKYIDNLIHEEYGSFNGQDLNSINIKCFKYIRSIRWNKSKLFHDKQDVKKDLKLIKKDDKNK